MIPKVLRVLAGLVIAFIAIYLILAWIAKPVPDHPFFENDEFLVIAHQGGEELRPSNTMASFSHAVELGVDVLEMDIHSTADDVLVVIHDDTVDRTTDGSGRLQDLTFTQVKQLDAGYYWTNDNGASFPFRGQGITIPALKEVLAAFPEMRMNIEIKQETPSIVQPFCQMLNEYGMRDKVLVASFHESTINEFRDNCPGYATSMVEPEIRLFFGLNLFYMGAIFQAPSEAIQVPEYSGNLHVVTERFVKVANKLNIDVHVWTVNETEDMRRLLDLGVNGIITDRPDRLLELINE